MQYLLYRAVMDAKSLISLWPSTQALAGDLGVNVETVRQWRKRNSIPARYWVAICEHAGERGLDGVTAEALARGAAEAA